jgi:uncharacterized protein
MEGQPKLEALYDPPSEMIQRAVLDRLVDFHLDYLKVATFFCLATGSENGLDASPRGGPPGFVQPVDEKTIVFADWPGNNRIESMRNIERDDRVGLVFLFPGLEVFMRINGRARISEDAALRERMAEGERIPKVVILVTIDQILFHCGKAINRAQLWNPESRLDRRAVPSPGVIMSKIARLEPDQAEKLDAHYDHRVRHDLY